MKPLMTKGDIEFLREQADKKIAAEKVRQFYDDGGWTVGMTVYVRWHDGWRQGTLSATRANNLSVRPGYFKVYLPGPALGLYQVPISLVRSDCNFIEDINETDRVYAWKEVD